MAARSKGRLKAREYLAAAASSRALFRELVSDAMGLLPPADATRTDLEPLESFLTLPALAERLRVSRSTVQGDIARLENFGWVTRARPRRLGHREGVTLHLLADVVAREETGEKLIVSTHMLSDLLPATKPAADPETPKTGLGRKWKG